MPENRLLSETSYDHHYSILDGATDLTVCAVCGNPIAWWEHQTGVIIGWMHYTDEPRRFRYCHDAPRSEAQRGPEAQPEGFQVVM